MIRQSDGTTGCAQTLRRAERICNRRGVRLTPQRRLVLEILSAAHQPMGAYEILHQLGLRRPGAKPPTVYRALAFLQEQGLVHRLESLNAFVSCVHPDHPHVGQFLICRSCGQVLELEHEGVERALAQAVAGIGFSPDSRIIEVTGRCVRCADGKEK